MTAESVIQQGRTFTEGLMTSAGVIRRSNGTTVTDPDTLIETPGYDTIYTGPCKLRIPTGTPSDRTTPGIVISEQEAILSLPITAGGSGDVTTGDIWECTANPMDPALIGRTMRIAGIHTQTYATARRFPVEEQS